MIKSQPQPSWPVAATTMAPTIQSTVICSRVMLTGTAPPSIRPSCRATAPRPARALLSTPPSACRSHRGQDARIRRKLHLALAPEFEGELFDWRGGTLNIMRCHHISPDNSERPAPYSNTASARHRQLIAWPGCPSDGGLDHE